MPFAQVAAAVSLSVVPIVIPSIATEDAYAVAETMDEQLFDFGGHNVRVVLDERKEPWFVLKDVQEILGITNVTELKNRLDQQDFSTTEVLASDGKCYQTTIVNESGLYDVIFQSRKPDKDGRDHHPCEAWWRGSRS